MARFTVFAAVALAAAVAAATPVDQAADTTCIDMIVETKCYAKPSDKSKVVADYLPNPCVAIACQTPDAASAAGCWLYATKQKCFFKGNTGADGIVPKCSSVRPQCSSAFLATLA
ncbi:hypothetical protein GQ42DRAFT_154954 [Ramicandelaber brevisporus]|nr:hypothetical protein GQ42DRAFT_154954 [Ramicandelaber brevisporus]